MSQCHCHRACICLHLLLLDLFGLERGLTKVIFHGAHLRIISDDKIDRPGMNSPRQKMIYCDTKPLFRCFFPVLVCLPLSLLLICHPAPVFVSKILWEGLICHIYSLTSCPNARKEIILTMCSASSRNYLLPLLCRGYFH